MTGLTGIRLEALPHPALPAQGPGRALNGNFVLNEFKVTALKTGDKGQPVSVALKNAIADFSQDAWAVAGAIDGNPETGWAVSPQFGKAHVAIFEIATPLANAEGTTLTFTLDQHWPDGVPGNTLRVTEMQAVGSDAEAALWNYLFGIDLVATVRGTDRPVDDSLRWRLPDARQRRLAAPGPSTVED